MNNMLVVTSHIMKPHLKKRKNGVFSDLWNGSAVKTRTAWVQFPKPTRFRKERTNSLKLSSNLKKHAAVCSCCPSRSMLQRVHVCPPETCCSLFVCAPPETCHSVFMCAFPKTCCRVFIWSPPEACCSVFMCAPPEACCSVFICAPPEACCSMFMCAFPRVAMCLCVPFQ